MDTFPSGDLTEEPTQKPFFILILLLMGMFLGSMATSALLLGLYGGDIEQWVQLQTSLNPDSPLADRMWVRWINFFNQLFTFTLPALATLLVVYRKDWLTRADLNKRPDAAHFFWSVVWIGLAYLVAQFIYTLNQSIPLPDWMHEMEQQTEGMVQALLVMEHPEELLLNIFVIAVLPAIGEELVFRGVLQKQVQRAFGKPHLAIWLSAALFSAIHFQFEGFLPRMLLGGVLGYLYYWSGNLWLPILAHLFNNGMQVLAWYFLAETMQAGDEMGEQAVSWVIGLPALVGLVLLGYYIRARLRVQNLPDPFAP